MELTLDQALQKGVEAHKAGKIQEADRYYTAILKANPKHPDANHNIGVLAVGVGKVEAALPLFKTALEANPNIAQFWLSYIDALIKLDRMEEAKAVFDQAKSNGAKGDGFDQLEQKINATATNKSNIQEPPGDQFQSIVNLYTQGQYQEVITQASQVLNQFPKSVNLYNITGAANQCLGMLNEALEAYNKAVSIKPDYADAYINIGNVFQEQGQLEEAIEAYNKALAINPNYAEAYINMGIALKDQGKLNEALEAYKKAVSIKPDYADTHFNIGVTLQEQGKLEEAVEAYNKPISIKPDYARAHFNIGVTLQEQGKLEEAVEAYNKTISIKPDYADAYKNMGIALKGTIFKKPNGAIQKTIVSLLDTGRYVRPSEILTAAISLLKLDPPLQKHLKLVDADVTESPLNIILDLINLPLLLRLMSVCPLPDLEIEKLFKDLRRSILLNISSLKEASPHLIRFQSALALQCFTNEYIYNHIDKEKTALKALEKAVEKSLNNNRQPSSEEILALASYKALDQYEWYNLLDITDDIKEVFTRQVEEPNHEEKLKQDLLILDEITDRVSSKVRDQYEESPYPRWVNLGLPLKPLPISKIVDENKSRLFDNKITEVENPEILIAGCGTGQHSIGTAATLKGSKVLAIDLSLASLAYAKRKTDEHGIENTEYMQADILDLGKLNKKFDIIESGGVLHHMDNPMAGWKVLTDCLKPGGLMKIGLYSELARQHVVKIRNEISNLGIGSSKEEMKSFRDTIMRSDKDHHKLIVKSPDFYSLSTLRDLLFHVKEHRFTIPQIKGHLDKLGLKFCGFGSKNIVSHFTQTNKARDDLYDLDKWQAYEEMNPKAFSRMYQFWCQKIE